MKAADPLPELPEEIVTRPDQFQDCCAYLACRALFGFDTEFVGEDTYHPRLCLIQVATDERLLLIDPLAVGDVTAFWELVADPGRTVVVHAGREEARMCRLAVGRPPGRPFDLQVAAGLVGMNYPVGYGTLVHSLLGVTTAKGETLTEWRRRPLTAAQVRYAFDDVRFLLPLWKRLTARLQHLHRLDWAEEECARLAALTAPEEGPSEKWRKLRGLGALDRRRLAVVRALFQWREELATQTNRPPRSIVRDDLLIEIARRGPVKERDLHVVRGLPRKNLDAILRVADEARRLPLEQCPAAVEREQDLPQVNLVTNVLTAVLGDWCARHRLATGLVASSQDVRLLVRARLQTDAAAASILTQGWRARHVLPELAAVLDGRRRVRIADIRAEAPFAYDEG